MYTLPHALRADLAKPMAPVLTTGEAVRAVAGRFLIAVGDVCSEEFLEHGVQPDVVVVDWKTQRHADLARFRERAAKDPDVLWLRVKNPAGTITSELWEAIVSGVASAIRSSAPEAPPGAAESSGRRTLIEVDGEEDLAALPAMLLAPEGAAVAYGQPNEGVVIVIVTPDVRRHVRQLIDRMEVA